MHRVIGGLPPMGSNHQPVGWHIDDRPEDPPLTRSEILAFQKAIKDGPDARVTIRD